MLGTLTQFAATKGNIFTALGVNWQTLILQIIAFLLLVVLMGRFVYPWLIRQVDARKVAIDEAAQAAAKARSDAEVTEQNIVGLLDDARKQADDILETARLEAQARASEADEKARLQAERTIAGAREQLARDIEQAKRELEQETLDLVRLATAKVTEDTLVGKASDDLIKRSLKVAGRE